MVHGKRKPLGGGGGAKDRHRRQPKSQYDPKAPMPVGFEARPVVPAYTSKHQTILELVENKDKKKKLEFQVSTTPHPPAPLMLAVPRL